MATDLVIGVAISGGLLFVGTASWYHPTLFLVLFDRHDVSPWPQVAFTPAAYLGGLFLATMVGFNLFFVQALVALVIGGAIHLRHERNPRGDASIWPSTRTANVLLGIGGVFIALGVGARFGVL